MQYAVIKAGGKQYKVAPGDIIEVDSIKEAEGQHSFAQVLLVNDGGTVTIGTPFIDGVSVSATVLGATKGDKIRVSKFKSKVRYRRTTGFRASLTKLKIESIGKKLKEEKKEKVAAKATKKDN